MQGIYAVGLAHLLVMATGTTTKIFTGIEDAAFAVARCLTDDVATQATIAKCARNAIALISAAALTLTTGFAMTLAASIILGDTIAFALGVIAMGVSIGYYIKANQESVIPERQMEIPSAPL